MYAECSQSGTFVCCLHVDVFFLFLIPFLYSFVPRGDPMFHLPAHKPNSDSTFNIITPLFYSHQSLPAFVVVFLPYLVCCYFYILWTAFIFCSLLRIDKRSLAVPSEFIHVCDFVIFYFDFIHPVHPWTHHRFKHWWQRTPSNRVVMQ